MLQKLFAYVKLQCHWAPWLWTTLVQCRLGPGPHPISEGKRGAKDPVSLRTERKPYLFSCEPVLFCLFFSNLSFLTSVLFSRPYILIELNVALCSHTLLARGHHSRTTLKGLNQWLDVWNIQGKTCTDTSTLSDVADPSKGQPTRPQAQPPLLPFSDPSHNTSPPIGRACIYGRTATENFDAPCLLDKWK